MIVVLVVIGLNFVIVRLAPGDPATIMAGFDNPSEEFKAAISAKYNLDKPLYVQFFTYVGKLMQGDLGESYYSNASVVSLIGERFGASLLLSGTSAILAVILGCWLGLYAGKNHGGLLDRCFSGVAYLFNSMPAFWLGMMLIMLFAVELQWLPTGGADEGLRSLILPAFTLGLFSAATICRLLRSNMIEVLGKEYIDVCKAKGLPARKVISKHALKNALSSILTMLGMQFASLLGGSVITETVFAWPGVGRLVIQSITSSDFAVVECIVFLMAVVFVVINFVVDILYCVINPRIRLQ